jgi:plastocyanin
MATSFPTSKDTLINPQPTDSPELVSHAAQHANANDAIEALETKVGVNNSADATSHDYKIRTLESYAISYETAQDAAGALLGHTNHTNLIATYDDVLNEIRLSVAAPDVARTIYQTAKNETGSTLAKGKPVYVTGAVGASGKIKVGLASNASEAQSSKTLGFTAESISNNGEGQIITEGLLSNINTVGGADGDPVWLGSSGSLIFGLANKPKAPQHLVFLGIVVRGEHANNGSIFVKIQNGFELEELHNVLIESPANSQALVYDSASGLWKNISINAGTGITKTYTSVPPNYRGDYDNGAYYAIDDVVSIPAGSPYGIVGSYFIRSGNPGNPGYPPEPGGATNASWTLFNFSSAITIGVDTSVIATQTYVTTAISNLLDGAPAALDTLNELAAAINDDASYAATITTALGTKLNSTTAASTYLALADTDERIQDVVGGMVSTNTEGGIEVTYDDPTGKLNFSVTPALITEFVESAQDASASLLNHSDHNKITATYNDETNKVILNVDEPIKVSVSAPANPLNGDSWFDHQTGVLYVYDGSYWIEVSGGTGFTASGVNDLPETIGYLDGATGNIQQQLNAKAPLSSPALTGTPTSTTASVDTDTTQIATTAYVVAQGYAKKASPTFTGTVVLPSTTSIGNITSTELGYIDGLTSSAQTQINTKAPSASPTFTGTVVLPSTTSIGTVDATEIAYLDGVTSAIQTQINSKLATTAFTYANIAKISYANVGSLPAAATNAGKVLYVQADGYIYYSTGSTWVKLAKFNDTTSLTYNINSLTDVDTGTVTPLVNQVLGWDGTNWIPVNQNSANPQITLGDITNVNLSQAPAIDDVLTFDGTEWIASVGGTSTPYIPAFSELTDIFKTADMIAYPAITRLNVTASGSLGYVFGDQYNNAVNPTVYAISGTTIAFTLNVPGHPFLIQTSGGVNYNTGLIHVDIDGTESIGGNAQAKTQGTVYLRVPFNTSGNYKYQCAVHIGMTGTITIKDISVI